MSFQDLLNQPLPSQMGDDYIMEAANPAKIATDVMDLNKTYKASTKAIKEKIASVRATVKSKKFQAALNIINNCRKDVINDRNEIGKRVKAIESAGLNKNTIRAIMAGTAIAGGVKLAYDASKSSKLKNTQDEAKTKFNAANDEYEKEIKIRDDKHKTLDKRSAEADRMLEQMNALEDDIRKQLKTIAQRENKINDDRLQRKMEVLDKYKDQPEQKRILLRKINIQSDVEYDKLDSLRKKLSSDRMKLDALNKKHSEISEKIGEERDHIKEPSEATKKLVDKHASEFNNASRNLAVHKDKVLTTNAAMVAGGAIPYATIKLFMLIKNNYEKYYGGVQKTLDELEDKCEKQSQNIKECLVDFVMLNQDMEMLMESVDDCSNEEFSTSGKVERRMSFSDLLNQPLPSKLYLEAEEDDDKYISDGDAYEDGEVRQQGPTNTEECGDNCKGGCGDPEDVTESVDLKDKKKIKQAVKDITSLSKAYQKSTKEIRESIKGIRVQIALKKFNGALNMINTCRKKVLADRKEIEKQINSIKSAGFDLESIKKAKKESMKKSAGKILGTAGVTAAGIKALDYLNDDSNVAHSAEGSINTGRILGGAALGVMAAGTVAGSAFSMSPSKFTNMYIMLKKVDDSYGEYYNTVLATLDSLENKCEDQSQNIKECLVDYITLSNSIEMLMESADDDDEDDINDDEDIDDDEEEDEDDIDISDMSDADLDELEEELADSDVEDAVDDVEEVDLTPEEEREADDFMSLAATTELVRDELSATERAEFYADPVQAQIAVVEGFMLESDFSDGQMVTEKFFNKTRVQFSKEDRKHQLFAVALNASARAHNDPDYIKLQKVQQMRRVLKARIRKKYRGEALRRVKVYMQRLKASKSGVLAKIGAKLHKDSKD